MAGIERIESYRGGDAFDGTKGKQRHDLESEMVFHASVSSRPMREGEFPEGVGRGGDVTVTLNEKPLTRSPDNATFPTWCWISNMTKRDASSDPLSRRERQVMNIIYGRGEATAAEIHEALPDPPTFSATRAVIRTLEDKGHIRHREQGLRYVYVPVVPAEKARRSAVAHLVDTLFQGSPSRLVAALLEPATVRVTDEEFQRLEQLIREAKERSKY